MCGALEVPSAHKRPSQAHGLVRSGKPLVMRRHPNIVRLYGYCVEPPRVCLVLELLPCSLSARIHGASPDAATGTTGTTGASSSGGSSRAGSPAKPATTTAYLTAVEGQPAAHGLPATEDDDSSGPPSSTSSSGGGGKGEQKGADEAAAPAVVAHKAAQQPQPLAPLTMLDVVRISADIAAGLAFLHSLRARVDDDGGGVGAGGVALGMRRVREDELELGEEDWHSAVAEERAATADATRIVHRGVFVVGQCRLSRCWVQVERDACSGQVLVLRRCSSLGRGRRPFR